MSGGNGTALGRPLDDAHREELRASGLTDDMIARAGIYSAADGAITELLGWKPRAHHWGRGWVIPFDGDYCRVKLDHPRHAHDGAPVKYESPRRERNRPYFPPGVRDAIEAGRDLMFTEGEKKSLAAMQAGFACIGLVGVWGWQLARQRTTTIEHSANGSLSRACGIRLESTNRLHSLRFRRDAQARCSACNCTARGSAHEGWCGGAGCLDSCGG
jgi:hypothetical protein